MEGFGQLPLLIMMLLAFYLILILPQTRRAKKEKKFISALKKGDMVVTKSGMHGRVLEVNDNNNTSKDPIQILIYFHFLGIHYFEPFHNIHEANVNAAAT